MCYMEYAVDKPAFFQSDHISSKYPAISLGKGPPLTALRLSSIL